MTFIPADEYSRIITQIPILCVDVLVRNPRGEYLLVRRLNEPKKGAWWPVGGRVLQDETLEDAAKRKVREEIGIDVERAEPIGYFEHVFDSNSFGTSGRYHTVSMVFVTDIEDASSVKLDDQSQEWQFSAAIPEDFIIRPFAAGVLR
jgi:colanic acid biosynthesis protein WcaH